MTVSQLNIPHAQTTNCVFEPPFDDQDDLAFHGTSCAYEPAIDVNGFIHGQRSYNPDMFRRAADQVRELDMSLASDLYFYANHPVKLSFTKKSTRALEYALKARGGQSLEYLRKAFDYLGKLDDDATALLNNIDESGACIYAIRLSLLPSTAYTVSGSDLHFSVGVPVSAIVAKLLITRGTNYTDVIPPKPPTGLIKLFESMSNTPQTEDVQSDAANA